MNKGKLIVFTGPSGTGKGTILSEVLKRDDRLRVSVSATTRQPREGEQNGVHYWFLSKEDFEERIAQDAFLEHACYVGNYYGTLEQPVNEQLEAGNDVVLEIEVQGAMQIHEKRPDAVMIFVAPPSMQALSERLHGRGTETPEKIAARLAQAEQELCYKNRFDYVIINDILEDAVADLCAILRAERCRVSK
ncbi:MAG: guanylate kinase [Butyricicoccus pullicaecorum]|nr:guanylate kinase [Butyricicoccus pullicaecorum]